MAIVQCGRGIAGLACLVAVALVAGSAPQAHAQGLLDAACTVGSKFPIVDYQDYPTNSVGRGHNMAAFLRGKDASNADKDYMMLVWSRDSGKGEGGISFWNWDTPAIWSAPTKKKHLVASQLREAHSTPVTNMFAPDWRTWVLQATTGFSAHNLASVATPVLVTSYAISGASKGGAGSAATCSGGCFGSFKATNLDYSGGAVWFLALAAPYLYVAQADNGLNIYKFTNQGNAASIQWVKRYDTSWFGHRVNQIWVRGNFAVAAAVQSNYGVTLLDLSNPESPVALKKYGLTTNPKIRNAYAWTLNGNWLYAATKQQGSGSTALLAGLTRYAIATDPVTQYKLTTQQKVDGGCSTGGYAAIQDNFAHIGLSTCVQKIDLDKIGTGQEPRQAPFPLPPPSPPPAYWKIDVVGGQRLRDPARQHGVHRQRSSPHARQRDPVSRCGRGHQAAGRERAQSRRWCHGCQGDGRRRPVVQRQPEAVDDQLHVAADPDPGQQHADRRLLQLSAQHDELSPRHPIREEHRLRGGRDQQCQGPRGHRCHCLRRHLSNRELRRAG